MKYVSRGACDGRGALGGVLKEVELLSSLEHPFLVNLWFSFQGKQNLNLIQNWKEILTQTHTCVFNEGFESILKVLITNNLQPHIDYSIKSIINVEVEPTHLLYEFLSFFSFGETLEFVVIIILVLKLILMSTSAFFIQTNWKWG